LSNIGNPPCDIGVIRSRDCDAPCEEKSRPWVFAATIIGSAMAFIDSTVTNVALPQIQERLGATATDSQWIVESYALFLSALILVGGSLGDHFGRRRIFSLGVIVFTLASVWCGLSTSPEMLIAARAVQGVGGAMLIPGSLAIISGPTRVRNGSRLRRTSMRRSCKCSTGSCICSTGSGATTRAR
jgi:MFS family permease